MLVTKLYTVGGYLATLRSKALMGFFDPPVVPPNTIRVRTSDGQPPIKGEYTTYETATLVPGTDDIYDVYKSGTSLYRVLRDSSNVVEVIDANTSNVTNMKEMFYYCTLLKSVPLFDTSNVTDMFGMFFQCWSLTSAPLFDTSNVTDMYSMFYGCSVLTNVPLFDTSNVTNIGYMFYECYKVQSGALALYQQASTQTTVPQHTSTFFQCGASTTTGAAELAQIPNNWK